MGSGRKINMNIADFKQFRKGNYLYVDKSVFIEHIENEGNTVLLFCRPRRMGKSMNLTMLKYFCDIKEKDTSGLFKGLYIESSPVYNERNTQPVIHLNFRSLHHDNWKKTFVLMVNRELERYLQPDQMSKSYLEAAADPYDIVTSLLPEAMKNLYDVYGRNSYILIDEYDKLFMDNANRPDFEEIRDFIKSVLSNALKDNPYLGRAVITGVNRISQESMFSDLNNITIFDIFTKSEFDTDFGFTEVEVESALYEVNESNAICGNTESQSRVTMKNLRVWYNNYRVGEKAVYFSFSVLSALQKGQLGNYWGRSGVMDMIRSHLTSDRVDQITELVNGFPNSSLEIYLQDRLTVDDLKSYADDSAFYSLLVQTGYLTYEHILDEEILIPEEQKIFLPNFELQRVWREFVLKYVYTEQSQAFKNVFKNIKDAQSLAHGLTSAMNNKLSFYDFEYGEYEKTYHVYIAGMMTAFGYKWISNRESGLGRYDLLVQLPKHNLIFEFKMADNTDKMQQSAFKAIQQIRERKYTCGLNTDKPTLLVGVGFFQKLCKVEVEEE